VGIYAGLVAVILIGWSIFVLARAVGWPAGNATLLVGVAIGVPIAVVFTVSVNPHFARLGTILAPMAFLMPLVILFAMSKAAANRIWSTRAS